MDKRLRLIRSLHDRTSEGRIAWEPTNREREFQASFPDYTISIGMRPNRNREEEDYGLKLYNADFDLIEEIWDEDVQAEENLYPFVLLRDTYQTARRTAMGVEKALDRLLVELDDPDLLPF